MSDTNFNAGVDACVTALRAELLRETVDKYAAAPAEEAQPAEPALPPLPDYFDDYTDHTKLAVRAYARAAIAAVAQPAEPVATLHGDGYWTWKKPRHEHDPAFFKMDVYAAPVAQSAEPVAMLTGDEIRAAVRAARLANGPSDVTEPTEYVHAGAKAMLAKIAAAPPAAQVRAQARSAKDYAIEHAEYLAQAAEHAIEAENDLTGAAQALDELDGDDVEVYSEASKRLDGKREAHGEAIRALRDAIYEFRKRRDRALKDQS